ncbi:flagella assembly protein FlgT [Aliidiomarina maris]|uniref:Flagellar assembly T-like protein n=1 Tax=Aliidiomarina maris TaxID=531312 RepID=A0A327XAK9_9GAMM|nr:flagella assembly protein FlgT [Aliidiomarina maris]RAK00707.1 flagellar assembly T-like protein [Aliidiomarina maris]RUO27293.1 hypothetical protein CWE07_04920 [Aliidiomarina maris]
MRAYILTPYLWRAFCALWLLSAASVISPAHAEWYESSASAPIVAGNTERARAHAIENALRQSLDFAGGRLSSVEHVVNGVLQGSHFEWASDGVIEQAHLVRERRVNDHIEVTVRAHIRQAHAQCAAADFRKGVAVVPFEFAQAEQVRDGELWQLDRAASARFAQLLGRHSQSTFLEHLIERKVGFSDFRRANNEQQMAGFARRVGSETDAQYVIAGVFDDLSTQQRGRNLTFWTQPKQDRHLGLTIYLLDTASGELVTRAHVRDQIPWTFDYHEQVDPHSQRFWQSAYGDALERAMRDMVFGLDDKLECVEPRGQVIRVSGRDVNVNLGANHGLQAGHSLHIYHRGNFVDNQGIYREQWVLSPYQLEVTQVQQSSAQARVVNDQPGGNIQVNDRVVVRP